MSILIKSVEMPVNCENCRFWYQEQDSEHNVWNRCTALNHKEIVPFITERREDCPLVEVPTPHGRLLDAKELLEWVEEYLNNAPAIIEAEEEGSFLKPGKGEEE